MLILLIMMEEIHIGINFITEDIDQCQEVNSDTIQLILNINLPENKSPEIN